MTGVMLFFMSSFPALTTQYFVRVSAGGSDVVRLTAFGTFAHRLTSTTFDHCPLTVRCHSCVRQSVVVRCVWHVSMLAFVMFRWLFWERQIHSNLPTPLSDRCNPSLWKAASSMKFASLSTNLTSTSLPASSTFKLTSARWCQCFRLPSNLDGIATGRFINAYIT